MKFINLKDKIFSLIFTSASVQVLNMLFLLAMSVLVARELGVSEYGKYTYLIALATLASIPMSTGMPNLIVREGAKFSELNQLGKLRGLLVSSNYFVMFYSTFVALLTMFLSMLTNDNTYLIVALLVPVMSATKILSAFLRSQYFTIISQFALVISPFIMVVLFIFFDDISIEKAVLFFVASLMIAASITYIIVFKKIMPRLKEVEALFDIKVWFYSLVPLTIYSGLSVLDSQIGILILGVISIDEVSYLKIGASSAALVTFGLTAVNMVIAPKISALYAKKKLDGLQILITKTAKFGLVIGVVISIVFLILSKELIIFIFGPEYYGAVIPFRILVIGSLLNASLGSVVLILNMTGNEKEVIKGVLLAVSINSIVCLLLISKLGAVGASIGGALSMIIWNIYLSIRVKKQTGLVSHAFYFGR